MGVVHEALHVALGRRVAVKTLLAEAGPDPDLVARFEREARAASAIGHPHIVDVFDLGRTPEGVLFMVMEFLDGKSLGDLLAETPCLPIPLALDLAGQMLGGLAAAHRNGIVHRDLKPDNIFIINTVDRPNFLKVLDFGISKILVRSGHGQRPSGPSTGTAVGTVLGTPLYMSPEQILGQVGRIDHRSDIYAAGVVLYEMLCGRPPFEGESHAKIFASILDGWYPLPRDLRRDIPANVEAAILRALDRDMDKRFGSAADMREAVSGRSAELTPAPVMVPVPASLAPLPARPPERGRAWRSLRATSGRGYSSLAARSRSSLGRTVPHGQSIHRTGPARANQFARDAPSATIAGNRTPLAPLAKTGRGSGRGRDPCRSARGDDRCSTLRRKGHPRHEARATQGHACGGSGGCKRAD